MEIWEDRGKFQERKEKSERGRDSRIKKKRGRGEGKKQLYVAK